MEVQLPKIKTVRVMLAGMTAQQESVFKMAFKMHNTTRYETVSPSDGSAVPDLVLADTDAEGGFELWKELAERYKDIPVAVCSEKVPDSEVPYLPKPIRFETLFPMLRKLLQGENVYGKSFIAPADRSAKNNGNVQRTVTIRQFNPNKGLLGALRFAEKNRQDIAILHGNKPVLIVFPSIQRILLTESVQKLEELCKDENLQVSCKTVPDNPQWREKAKVGIMSCMWQFSIWTAQGRLIYPISPDTPFTLKSWPNLTRLASVPGSIRLSAFLTKASVNLNVLYKVMPLNLNDILNYLAATYTTGFLSVDLKTVSQQAYSDMADKINIGADSASDSEMMKKAEKITTPSQSQSRGLLQRLMKKLLGS